jgi:tetratricopeptide (TPR) repeat protein
MRRAVVGLLVVLLLAGMDGGPPPAKSGQEAAERVLELVEAGQLSAASRLGKSEVERFPNDAAARAAYGLALFAENRFAEAQVELEKAAELAPQDPGIWAVLGIVRVNRDDEAGAEAAWMKAIAIAPDQPEVRAGLADLAERKRLREKRRPSPPASGSPAALVWQLGGLVAQAQWEDVWIAGADLDLDARLRGEIGGDERTRARRMARELRGFTGSVRVVAWDIDANIEQPEPDRAIVTVRLYVLRSFDADTMRLALLATGTSEMADTLDGETVAGLRRINRADLEAMLKRRIGTAVHQIETLRVELRRRGEAWRVVDAVYSGPRFSTRLGAFVERLGVDDLAATTKELNAAAKANAPFDPGPWPTPRRKSELSTLELAVIGAGVVGAATLYVLFIVWRTARLRARRRSRAP